MNSERPPSGPRLTFEQPGKERPIPVAVPAMNDWSVPDDTPAWQFRGACRGEDPTLFFAPGYFERREEKDRREAKAKAICARCPVRIDCLEYALHIREPHGVWGGMNEQERRALLRERARQVS